MNINELLKKYAGISEVDKLAGLSDGAYELLAFLQELHDFEPPKEDLSLTLNINFDDVFSYSNEIGYGECLSVLRDNDLQTNLGLSAYELSRLRPRFEEKANSFYNRTTSVDAIKSDFPMTLQVRGEDGKCIL